MRFQRKSRGDRGEQGYILMTLLLIVALMIIFAAVIVPSITFEIKRDKEEEMIHRGVQYSRAIRAYYRKFGRYPAKIEDLENTNQQRYLRKRYKDPLTGKDFKLLHFGEAKMAMGGMGGGVIPGANTLGANGQLTNPNGLQQTSAFGNSGGFGNSGAFGSNSNTAFGQNSPNATSQTNSDTTQTPSDSTQAGSNGTQAGTPQQPGSAGTTGTTSGFNSSNSGDKLSNTTFGGAPIVGVASTSKDKTIREFDKKKKYNEWQFVYDPTFDRGQLITTPYQPSLQQLGMQGTTNVNGPNGQSGPGQNGTNNTGFGNSFGNGFGNSQSPAQNNPNQQNNNGFGNPTQPPSLPPDQK